MASPTRKVREGMGFGEPPEGTSRIIELVIKNDFAGVDKELNERPELINARREGSQLTPIMVAAGYRMVAMVDHLLLKPGIDLDLVDASGRSAFDHARIFPEIVGRLMSAKYPGMKWKEPLIKPVEP